MDASDFSTYDLSLPRLLILKVLRLSLIIFCKKKNTGQDQDVNLCLWFLWFALSDLFITSLESFSRSIHRISDGKQPARTRTTGQDPDANLSL